MDLESLANELLLDLFEHLSVVDLLRAFHRLNLRFDTLISSHLRNHSLDFNFTLKHDFDIICQQHLPLILDRIIALRFAESPFTHQQIGCFLANGLTFRQFTQLRSLTFYDIHDSETMNKLIFGLSHLSNLTHLNFDLCLFPRNEQNALSFMNNIWSLPKLVHFHFGNPCENGGEIDFPVPTISSSVLNYLSIVGYKHSLGQMARLFEHTPHLRHLTLGMAHSSYDKDMLLTIPSVTSLHISFCTAAKEMAKSLLYNLPNLRQLRIHAFGTYMDGHRMEQKILNHFPKLEMLRFEMQWVASVHMNMRELDQLLDEIIDSYQSQFWVNERRWFVRCDWDLESRKFHLYTLPFAFWNFSVNRIKLSKSTCPHDDDRWSYNHARHLIYKLQLSENPILSRIHCISSETLSVAMPVDNYFWSVVSTFDRLTCLHISFSNNDKISINQLQTILDRASRLHTLDFSNILCSYSKMPPFELTSISVRRLIMKYSNQYYSKKACARLSCSPLGIQCQALSINVKKRTCIIDLVRKIPNLQVLYVQCNNLQDKKKNNHFEWLQHHLPSLWTVTQYSSNKFLLQIRYQRKKYPWNGSGM